MNERETPAGEVVSLDVLVLGRAAADAVPTAETIDDFRPSPVNRAQVRGWFETRAIACTTTEFGVVVSVPIDEVATIFGPDAAIEASELTPIPSELGDLVSSITVSQPPEYFW